MVHLSISLKNSWVDGHVPYATVILVSILRFCHHLIFDVKFIPACCRVDVLCHLFGVHALLSIYDASVNLFALRTLLQRF